MGDEYDEARLKVDTMLYSLIKESYGPSHTVDVLKECIKLLQPYAKKQEEVTHA